LGARSIQQIVFVVATLEGTRFVAAFAMRGWVQPHLYPQLTSKYARQESNLQPAD
jgi:hypothetical protein